MAEHHLSTLVLEITMGIKMSVYGSRNNGSRSRPSVVSTLKEARKKANWLKELLCAGKSHLGFPVFPAEHAGIGKSLC